MDRFEQDPFEQDPFEKELRNALRRQTPSHDFAARLETAAKRRSKSWWLPLAGYRQLRWAAAGMLFLLVAGGLSYEREQQMQLIQGEAAKEQVMIALRIAGSKIRLAQTKVQNLSER
jgi:hypothetical protein